MSLLFLSILSLTSCTALPDIMQTADDIMTDDAITVKVDRDAFKKETDVHISVDVINKDPRQP